MKVIMAMGLEETLDLVLSRSLTIGANRAFLNEQNRAIMLVSDDGKFADTWLKNNAGVDLIQRGDIGAPIHNSSLIDVR